MITASTYTLVVVPIIMLALAVGALMMSNASARKFDANRLAERNVALEIAAERSRRGAPPTRVIETHRAGRVELDSDLDAPGLSNPLPPIPAFSESPMARRADLSADEIVREFERILGQAESERTAQEKPRAAG